MKEGCSPRRLCLGRERWGLSRKRIVRKSLRRQKREAEDHKDAVLSEACVYSNKLWERSWWGKAMPSEGMM